MMKDHPSRTVFRFHFAARHIAMHAAPPDPRTVSRRLPSPRPSRFYCCGRNTSTSRVSVLAAPGGWRAQLAEAQEYVLRVPARFSFSCRRIAALDSDDSNRRVVRTRIDRYMPATRGSLTWPTQGRHIDHGSARRILAGRSHKPSALWSDEVRSTRPQLQLTSSKSFSPTLPSQ
jgi:hypothetical protein